MKRILFLLMAALAVCVLATPAHATLINRGTDTLGNRLIYDDDLDITWYDYTHSAGNWTSQVAWADTLSVDFGGDIFNDWRLPTTVDGPYVFGYDGTTTVGYNITTSEMGHLFYTELGNDGDYDTSGNSQAGGLTKTGVFQHLNSYVYWSGTENLADTNTDLAWYFSFRHGSQYPNYKTGNYYGLAVRSGDVAAAPVPEPATIVLLGIGLAGMGVYGARRRRHR